ncbi:hypothetical protein Q6247_25780, partial [Klebsiella pneumoniae]
MEAVKYYLTWFVVESKNVPSRLKALMKDSAVECAKNVMVLLKMHFPRLAVEHVGTSIAEDFDVGNLLEL